MLIFYTTAFISRYIHAAPRSVNPDYIQHNPQVRTALELFMDVFRRIVAPKPLPAYRRDFLNDAGDNGIVVIHVRQSGTDADRSNHLSYELDPFRVDGHKIAEHWDAGH